MWGCVIGIVAVVVGFMRAYWLIALIAAVLGLILGFLDARQKSKQKKPKTVSIAGIVLSAIAVVVIIVVSASKKPETAAGRTGAPIEQGQGLPPGAGAPPSVEPGAPGGPPVQPGEGPAAAPGIGTPKGPPARPKPLEKPGKPDLPSVPDVKPE